MSSGKDGCRTLPFTLLFWVVFLVTQIGHRQVAVQQSMQKALLTALKSTETFEAPATGDDCAAATPANTTGRRLLTSVRSRITGDSSQGLDDISTTDRILFWLSQSFVPQLWTGQGADRGLLLFFNRALGGVRIQQLQLGRSRCPGGQALLGAYNLSCYNRELEPQEVSAPLPGIHVDPETGFATQWLDLASEEDAVQAQIDELFESEWLTYGAKRVRVQTIMFNLQVSLIAYAEVNFVVDRVGRLTSKTTVYTLPTEVYGDAWLIWSGDMLLLGMILALMLMESYACCRAWRLCGLGSYCSKESALNWSIVVLGTGFSAFFGYLASALEDLSAEFAAIPRVPGGALSPPPVGWSGRHRALDEVYDEVVRLTGLLRACELSTFWYSLLLLLKFFKAFEASPRLSVTTNTLREAASDIFHFMVVFGIVFLTFTLGAYFLFGHKLEEWSSLGTSINSAFRALMGDFSFDDMYEIAPFSAMVWFWIFMSLIFLVMLNMLLAIILDTYTEVKGRLAEERDSLLCQADEFKKRVSTTFLGHLSNAASGEGPLKDGAAERAPSADRCPSADRASSAERRDLTDLEITSLQDHQLSEPARALDQQAPKERPTVDLLALQQRKGQLAPAFPNLPQVPRLVLPEGRASKSGPGTPKWFSQGMQKKPLQ